MCPDGVNVCECVCVYICEYDCACVQVMALQTVHTCVCVCQRSRVGLACLSTLSGFCFLAGSWMAMGSQAQERLLRSQGSSSLPLYLPNCPGAPRGNRTCPCGHCGALGLADHGSSDVKEQGRAWWLGTDPDEGWGLAVTDPGLRTRLGVCACDRFGMQGQGEFRLGADQGWCYSHRWGFGCRAETALCVQKRIIQPA